MNYILSSNIATSRPFLRPRTAFIQTNVGSTKYLPRPSNRNEMRYSGAFKYFPFECDIERLATRKLRQPIKIVINRDDGGYIVTTPMMPIYGYGDNIDESIDMIRDEIESLYCDLIEDTNLPEFWNNIKKYLICVVE